MDVWSNTTVQQTLNLKEIRQLPIPWPPSAQRKRIAHILGTLDDKIELNRKMNETLEQMARALFKSWFVDFDPVRAKAEGRKPVGMDEATAELFPDAFENSALGKIPRGWVCTPLSQLSTIKHGYAFKGEYFCDEPTEHVLVTPRNFRVGGGFQESDPKYYRGPIPPDFILHPGDLVVTMTDLSKNGDTLGYAARIPTVGALTFLHNQRIGRVELLHPHRIGSEVLFQILTQEAYRAEVLASSSGSTVKHTSPGRILSYRVTLAPMPVQSCAERMLKPIREKLESNNEQTRILSELRDQLLPRLVSGELAPHCATDLFV
jgi:type I restriction enzyme S subunit